MRIMGLDLGEKRIGVALSDPLGWTAQGLQVIPVSGSLENSIASIQRIARQYEVERVIVGLPRNMDGSLSPVAKKIKSLPACCQRDWAFLWKCMMSG